MEDDIALRRMTASLLRAGGYEILEAGDAASAISLASLRRGAIQLLLTDVIMPGMGGGELAAHLLQSCSELEVLYMSGYTGDRIPNRELLEGGSRPLEKPFSKDVLLRKVRSLLDSEKASTPTG